MLELRPICENCAKPLPPASTEACICSFECTFCRDCVDQILLNVCPNCGGGFEKRPVRPSHNWRNGNDVVHYPPVSATRHRPVDAEPHQQFAAPLRKLKPEER